MHENVFYISVAIDEIIKVELCLYSLNLDF